MPRAGAQSAPQGFRVLDATWATLIAYKPLARSQAELERLWFAASCDKLRPYAGPFGRYALVSDGMTIWRHTCLFPRRGFPLCPAASKRCCRESINGS